MAALLRMEEEIEGGNYRRDLQREPGAKCKAGYEVLLLFYIYLFGRKDEVHIAIEGTTF